MTEREDSLPAAEGPRAASSVLGKLGFLLILLSGVFFFAMLAVPWMPLAGNHKVIVGGALFAAVQISWWVGAAMVGPATIAAMRNWFRR